MEIKNPFTELKDMGKNAYSKFKTSVSERKHKKEEMRRHLILMSGCIKRVK